MPSDGMMRAVDLSRPRDEENAKTLETQGRPARTWSQAGSKLTATLPLVPAQPPLRQCLAKRQRALFTPSFVGTRLNPPVTFVGTRTHLLIALFHTRTHPLVAMSGECPAPTSPGSPHGRTFVLWPARIRPHVFAARLPVVFVDALPTRSSSLSGDHPPRASALSGECPAPTSPGSPHGRTFVLWPARIRPHVFASLSARISTRSSPLSARGPRLPVVFVDALPHPLVVFVGRPSPRASALSGECPAPTSPRSPHDRTFPHPLVTIVGTRSYLNVTFVGTRTHPRIIFVGALPNPLVVFVGRLYPPHVVFVGPSPSRASS
ncbi:hypothetical protein B0H14DRAFT_3497506 [Mycena olivaceomarginata]|nr:hypothetical protein B0H14DRAFT_3497506 [Mycena olivaceomarginata]